MLYFLYYTKSRKKAAEPPKNATKGGGKSTRSVLSRQGHCREAAKDLILLVGSYCLCALIRGLQNLESPLEKVLILLVRNRSCGALNRGLQNLEAPCKGTSCYFLRRAKSNQKHAEGCGPLDSQGAIQISARYVAFVKMTGHHHVTSCVGNRNLPGYRR